MARSVAILGRSYLPGVGFNTSGAPKQGKSRSWGRINISSYTTNGEAISPNDLGLSAVDNVSFTVVSVAAADTAATAEASAVYRPSAQLLLVFAAAATQVTSTNAAIVSFEAVGDSANDAEAL